jgi:hypothetical protein
MLYGPSGYYQEEHAVFFIFLFYFYFFLIIFIYLTEARYYKEHISIETQIRQNLWKNPFLLSIQLQKQKLLAGQCADLQRCFPEVSSFFYVARDTRSIVGDVFGHRSWESIPHVYEASAASTPLAGKKKGLFGRSS